MPKKIIEEVEMPIPAPVKQKPKKTRTMTPEMLEHLKRARELAFKARKEGKQINHELDQAKKETFSEKIDQVETYKKLKEKVETEVKQNEIVNINKHLSDLNTRFNGFLEDRMKAKEEKAKMKQEKRAREYAPQVPNNIDRSMLEQSLRALEIENYRKRYFGV
jgi:hypothetical protein